ncbi:MAG: type II toxin-antitoxin system VapB family antitoxin [Dehalococcoidia bacterium]|nr:type II toxin-antitoxin system VapB family antitoxin [Dehalococcoidia bacterium]
MRTTLDIDSRLLDRVVNATGESSKSKAVNVALKEFIRRKYAQELIDSWGRIVVDDFSEEAAKLDERRRSFLDSIGKDPS